MKKLLLSAAALCCFVSAQAQWQPTGATSGPIYYNGGTTGNVGIGTTTPKSKLDLGGNFGAPGTAPNKISLYWQATNNYYGFGVSEGTLDYFTAGHHRFHAFDAGGTRREVFSILQSGNVVVGTPAPASGITQGDYKLNVWGRARANEIVVNTNGADFVFANDYRLRPLGEVEQFITNNKHLPEIPSAKEMQQNGMGVGELQTKLLQKVEELTLYVIEQNKQLQALKEENAAIKKQLKSQN